MTTIEASTDERTAKIAGLRELADFLDGHPDVPMPFVLLHTQHSGRAALAAWLDGLTDLDVRPGIIDAYREVPRTFAGLEVRLTTMAEYVGEVREVPGTVTEFTPFTADEIRERACTGERYLLNDHAPDEGTDIVHVGPCPVHADAEVVAS